MRKFFVSLAIFVTFSAFASTAMATHALVRSYSVGWTFGWGEHAFADSWATSRDLYASWMGHEPGYCNNYSSSSGCSPYDPWNGSWTATGTPTSTNVNQYWIAVPGSYGSNGVCHQAANRALKGTPVPWVRSTNIGMSWTSYSIYCDCGVTVALCRSCTTKYASW